MILAAPVEVLRSVSIGTGGMGSEWLRQTGAKSWNQGCQTGNVFSRNLILIFIIFMRYAPQ